jgi:hypothetical protein
MNGGYALVDCTGVDLSNLGTVNGLYSKLDSAIKSGKFVLLANVVNGDTKFSPIPSFGGYDDDGIFMSFEPVTIHVTSSDVVSI